MNQINGRPNRPARNIECITGSCPTDARTSHVQSSSLGFRVILLRIVFTCLLQVCVGHSVALAQPGEPIPWALLPKYCAESELSPNYKRFGERWQYWTNLMGPNFNRIHHYCQGLVHLMRAKRMLETQQNRRIVLKLAIGEFDFILNGKDAWTGGFPLLPEMLVRKGEAAALLQDWGTAYTAYLEARKAKPDYWPAYLGWAEVLIRIGKREEARSLLNEGLKFSPDSAALRELFVQAGGRLEDIPEPAAAPASAPESNPESAAVAAPAEPAASATLK